MRQSAQGPARASAGRLLLALALLFVVLIGGTDVGRYLTPVRAISAAIGAGMVIFYIRRAPAAHDIVDKLVLGALGLFLLACALSAMPRPSFDAATTATAFAAAFYLARGAVAEPGGWRLATTILGLTGALVSIAFLGVWATVWLQWVSIPGAGAPPLDLNLPATPYRHYYLVGMLAALLLPATLQLARRPGIWPLGIIGSAASIAVAFMSGSRTVWLAGLVALLLVAAIAGRRRLPRLTWRWAGAGILAAAILVLVSGSVISRLTAGSTVTLRLGIWDTSVHRWLESPLAGFGPGTFASQLGLAGYYDTHESLIPHAHNAAVQLLVEAGVLGIAVLVVIGVAVGIGLVRAGPIRVMPLAGLTFFAASTLTDNPTVIAYLLAPAIVWAAMALPREHPARERPARWAQSASIAMAVVVGAASAVILFAAATYDSAAVAANDDDSGAVTERLEIATTLDPSNALYQRDLAVWLLAAGRIRDADTVIQRAVALNPGDAAAWRSASLIAQLRGESGEALTRAERAVQVRATDALNQLTLAYVARAVGEDDASLAALVTALSTSPWITATDAWQESFGDATAESLAAANAQRPAEPTDRNVRADSWLGAMVGDPLDPKDIGPIESAASAVIGCDAAKAKSYVDELPKGEAVSADALLVRILIARATGAPDGDLLTLAKLRWPFLAFISERDVDGTSPLTGPADDVQLYGRLSLPAPSIGPILPTSESGLSAWLRDPVTAARVGAPQSPLATCR